MNHTVLTSVSNPLIKALRALAQKKTREARGEFLCEGIQLVVQAVQSGAPVKMIVVAPDLLTSAVGRALVRAQERAGTRIVRVSRAVFESFAERENPSGLAGVVKIAPRALDTLYADADAIFVALHQVSNPGNLGAILRTADAVGARGVIVIGAATDPYAPAAVKASRGALFTVPLVRVRAAQDFLDWAHAQNLRLVTTSDRAAQDVWQADLRAPLVVMFGSEGEGLPENLLRAGSAVRIPMFGQMDSLNLAVAASVLLYEVKRRLSTER
jgi:TrmH family RNA methyltransferase